MTRVDLGIAGKVALVTAGTRGIGLGIAQALAGEGVRVAVAARTQSDVTRTAASLNGFGVVADLMTEEGGRRAVEETEKALGAIDILVNNLGLRAGSSWSDTGPKELEAAFSGNATVSLRMTQLVLPGMVRRGWGRGDGAQWGRYEQRGNQPHGSDQPTHGLPTLTRHPRRFKRFRSWNQSECWHMPGSDDREMTPVEGSQLRFIQTLDNGENSGVDKAEWKIAVAIE